LLETKTVASVAIFTALAIALEPIRIPLFFWPGQYFHFWEIPILVAFFLFGLKVAFAISVLDAVGYFVVFPDGAGIAGPPWRLIVMATMFLGLTIAKKLSGNIERKQIAQTNNQKIPLIYSVLPTITRVAIMPFVDVAIYRLLLPLVIGHPIPDVYIMGLIPAFIFFNIVVPLYSVPIAYFAAMTVRRNFPTHYFQTKTGKQ
jgi:riboflavin transporter FmnP